MGVGAGVGAGVKSASARLFVSAVLTGTGVGVSVGVGVGVGAGVGVGVGEIVGVGEGVGAAVTTGMLDTFPPVVIKNGQTARRIMITIREKTARKKFLIFICLKFLIYYLKSGGRILYILR